MLNNSKRTITDADLTKLEIKLDKKFVTKKEFKENNFEVKSKFEELMSEIKDMSNDFSYRFDQVMGELKATREE